MNRTALNTARLTLMAALAWAAVTQAQATAVTFSDRAAFTAAVPGITTIDFGNTSGFTYFSGLTSGNVSFSAPQSGYLFVAGANNGAYQWNSGSSLLFGSTNEGGNLVITLTGGVHSFGFDFMAEADSQPDSTAGLTYGINVDGSSFTATTLQRPNRGFFGITSDAALSSITLTMGNTRSYRVLPIIDNVSYSLNQPQANAVPEPGSLALVGLALCGLRLARRGRQAAPMAVSAAA